jgi:hypothetical protein
VPGWSWCRGEDGGSAGWACTFGGTPGFLVGLFLLARGPRVIGALLVALGLLPLALLSPDSGVDHRAAHGFALVLAVMSMAGWVWLYVPPALLAVYFPDGRLGRRWWVLPAGWCVVFRLISIFAVASGPPQGPSQCWDGRAGLGPDACRSMPTPRCRVRCEAWCARGVPVLRRRSAVFVAAAESPAPLLRPVKAWPAALVRRCR